MSSLFGYSVWRVALASVLFWGVSPTPVFSAPAVGNPEGTPRLVYHEWNKRLAGLIGEIKQGKKAGNRDRVLNDAALFAFVYWYQTHSKKAIPHYEQLDRSVRWLGSQVFAEGDPKAYLRRYGNALIEDRNATVAEKRAFRRIDILPIEEDDFVQKERFGKLIDNFAHWVQAH